VKGSPEQIAEISLK
jgi:cation-transporting P-type ATPase 13A2